MLIEVHLWGGDCDEVAFHVRPVVGHDGNPPAALYLSRDAAGVLIGLIAGAAAGDNRTRRP